MTRRHVGLENPLDAGASLPYLKQHQEATGVESEVLPGLEHGERTYLGSGKLKDKVPLISGVTY